MGEVPAEAIGPKMQALRSDRHRKFAWIMACGERSAAKAARQAGFSDKGEGAKVRAHHMMHDPAVLDAIEEASRNVLRGLAPIAIRQAKGILENDKHPQHARMIETVLDRTGFFAKTEHRVTVEHIDDGRMLEFAARLAMELGIDRARIVGGNEPKLIEGKIDPAPDA